MTVIFSFIHSSSFFLGTQLSVPMEFELPTKFETYDINASNDSDEVSPILDKHSDPTKTSDLFIVVCSARCIEDVLRKVDSNPSKFEYS